MLLSIDEMATVAKIVGIAYLLGFMLVAWSGTR